MPDKITCEVSNDGRQYIEALVEEVILEEVPFQRHKRYLSRFCGAEGIDYETLVSALSVLFETAEELKTYGSTGIERLFRLLGKDCYLSDKKMDYIIGAIRSARGSSEDKRLAEETAAKESRERAEREKEAEIRKAREEVERLRKELNEQRTREEEERRRRDLEDRNTREETERLRRELEEQRAVEEKRRREYEEKKAREEAERRRREQEEQEAKEEEERRRRELEEWKSRKEAERKAKEREMLKRQIAENEEMIKELERKVRVKQSRENAGDRFNFVHVEGGFFRYKGEGFLEAQFPYQSVRVPSFYISKYVVTQEQWIRVMGSYSARGSYYENRKGNRLPAIVKWNAAREFIEKLSTLTGKKFRIPSEAEWDYAAAGGCKTCNYRYCGSNNYDDTAWRVGEELPLVLHEVGLKRPNELGLYDMCGNVEEWCDSDWDVPYLFKGILKGAAGYGENELAEDDLGNNSDGYKSIWARQFADEETMASFRLLTFDF